MWSRLTGSSSGSTRTQPEIAERVGAVRLDAAWPGSSLCETVECWSTGCVQANHTAGSASEAVLTPRLVLAPVNLDDVDDLLVLYGDPQVAYWTGPWARGVIEAWAAGMAARWVQDGVGKWMVRDRSDGSLVGRGGFIRVDMDDEMVLELGWVVRDARTGRGYATELGRAALAWAAEHRPGEPVVAFTEVHNRASRAVMERLGMLPAGTIRREGLVEGQNGVQPDAPFALYRLSSRGESRR